MGFSQENKQAPLKTNSLEKKLQNILEKKNLSETKSADTITEVLVLLRTLCNRKTTWKLCKLSRIQVERTKNGKYESEFKRYRETKVSP